MFVVGNVGDFVVVATGFAVIVKGAAVLTATVDGVKIGTFDALFRVAVVDDDVGFVITLLDEISGKFKFEVDHATKQEFALAQSRRQIRTNFEQHRLRDHRHRRQCVAC